MLSVPIVIISLFFFCGAMGHFFATSFFVAIMPGYLPYPETLVLISGWFELFGSVGLLTQKTRRVAALGLIALCVAVFPANLNMALNAERFADFPALVLYLRLPLQALLIGFIHCSIIKKEDQPVEFSRLHHTSASC